MVDTTFNFIIDDDVYLIKKSDFKDLVTTINQDNSIYGFRCGFGTDTQGAKGHLATCDHVAQMIYPRVKHLKIMFQQKLFTYSGGEDIELSVINHISCTILSRHYVSQIETSTFDEFKSESAPQRTNPSYHNISFPSRTKEMERIEYFSLYQHYIDEGFVPYVRRQFAFMYYFY